MRIKSIARLRHILREASAEFAQGVGIRSRRAVFVALQCCSTATVRLLLQIFTSWCNECVSLRCCESWSQDGWNSALGQVDIHVLKRGFVRSFATEASRYYLFRRLILYHSLNVSQCNVLPRSSSLSEPTFHAQADRALEHLFEAFETLLDDLDIEDSDVELSQGVLTLRLGDLGTYVINKQTPNRQIWMSSPIR